MSENESDYIDEEDLQESQDNKLKKYQVVVKN